ncbi:hypothetical protein [Pseudazoarcus pumilus]|uniref:Uncharacterized protein n=1 Tax=Pseudazoarcus pumilus TaxID=2067960 RepID=A0A2I6S6D1_9RHOO|nr:hypothetical protein [Pseudazoarcus pumilus]AUN94816.1 hypothetical protein C0099_07650 [Pseudazoarcus pumilus]
MDQERSTSDEALRLARVWRIHWPEIEPTTKRYQDAVPLSRVLAEHHAAIAAEPLENRNHE